MTEKGWFFGGRALWLARPLLGFGSSFRPIRVRDMVWYCMAGEPACRRNTVSFALPSFLPFLCSLCFSAHELKRSLLSPFSDSVVAGLRLAARAHVPFHRRVWAKKPYVDQRRIGIWGWVRVVLLCCSPCAPSSTPRASECECVLTDFFYNVVCPVLRRIYELQGG